LAYLDKKDLDKIVSDLPEEKRKKLKKLFIQKKQVKNFRKKYLQTEKTYRIFLDSLDKKTKKEEIKKDILSQTNSEIIDYILDSNQQEFQLNLAKE
jgi:vacuolar-type H+-ATPase subunit H